MNGYLSDKKLNVGFGLFLSLSIIAALFFPARTAAQQDNLQYEVDVRAQIVPIFAVDSKGNPIYDLKEEEIEFYVNGKPAKISTFTPYTVEPGKTAADGEKVETKIREKINFIIVGSTMGVKGGANRVRALAEALIRAGGPGDAFVVLRAHYWTGFQYVAGPGKDKETLIRAMREVPPQIIFRAGGKTRMPRISFAPPGSKEREMQNRIADLNAIDVESGRKQYQKGVRIFTRALSQLKYALKTITLPKNIFLITAGLEERKLKSVKRTYRGRQLVENRIIQYYDFLKDAAVAVNYGGSMLYLLNPSKPRSVSDSDSLKFMAEVSGGKYFRGRDIPGIVEKVKKSTAA
ncbi:MAG: hypothetical protein GY950_07580, partial [bacterium]|nr:hypothetical protein [bacterium]